MLAGDGDGHWLVGLFLTIEDLYPPNLFTRIVIAKLDIIDIWPMQSLHVNDPVDMHQAMIGHKQVLVIGFICYLSAVAYQPAADLELFYLSMNHLPIYSLFGFSRFSLDCLC